MLDVYLDSPAFTTFLATLGTGIGCSPTSAPKFCNDWITAASIGCCNDENVSCTPFTQAGCFLFGSTKLCNFFENTHPDTTRFNAVSSTLNIPSAKSVS